MKVQLWNPQFSKINIVNGKLSDYEKSKMPVFNNVDNNIYISAEDLQNKWSLSKYYIKKILNNIDAKPVGVSSSISGYNYESFNSYLYNIDVINKIDNYLNNLSEIDSIKEQASKILETLEQ